MSRSGARNALVLTVLGLTLLAGAVRLHGLAGPDGRLDRDEAKLALAADGVLADGLPLLPSGRLYTRGLLTSYLIAGSFAVFGRSDFAARLPSALAGALLVPVVFLLGRALGGSAARQPSGEAAYAGLAAGAFVALAPPLVAWSRIAWLPSVFLLLFTLAAFGCYRGFVEGRAGWQVAGAVFFCLGLLAYEFSVLLLGAVGLYLGLQLARRRWDWYRGRPTLAALGLLLGGAALFVALALALRAGTLAGPLSEVKGYVAPVPDLDGVGFYLATLLEDYPILTAAALLSVPLVGRANPGGTLFLGGLLGLAFLVPSLVLQAKFEPRYILPSLPLLAVLAAAGAVQLARLVGGRAGAGSAARAALPPLALLAVFSPALASDGREAMERFGEPPPGPTWLQSLGELEVRPDDLVLTEGPERALFYLGRVDFHIYTSTEFRIGADGLGYERYSYQAPDAIRSIYTNSALLNREGDFERLVEQPNPRRTLWVLGQEDRLRRLANRMDAELYSSLFRSAGRRVRADDNWILLRLTLPRRVQPE